MAGRAVYLFEIRPPIPILGPMMETKTLQTDTAVQPYGA